MPTVARKTSRSSALPSTMQLGRIGGVEVDLHWTWLVVVWLITFSLADQAFPEQEPGLSGGAYWAMGIAATLLFFASLLLHELGHARQALREGIGTDGITLWLFGGIARLQKLHTSAGADFRIAVAGPAVTAVIAAVLLGLAGALHLPPEIDAVVMWLGYMNVLLLAFNLLPALPLDGGRILHAALWKARGDLRWATHVGASIGQGFGLLMIGGGSALFIYTGAFGGLWFALIGWFLMSAAGAEERQLEVTEAIAGLRVRDLMSPHPLAVSGDFTLGRFVDEVARSSRHATYPVVHDGAPTGLLTFRRVLATPRREWDSAHVADCMLGLDAVAVLAPDTGAVDALAELSTVPTRRALVVDAGGRLIGLLSLTDLVRAAETSRGHPSSPDAKERTP